MIHIVAGAPRSEAHSHDTVAEARDCELSAAEAKAEVYAENAWLRAAEYSPRVNEEDRRELELEAWLLGR